MRNRPSAILFVIAAAVSLAFQAPAGWSRLDSEEGRFVVLMPGRVAPRDQPRTSTDPKLGTYTVHTFRGNTPKGFFMASWVDYDPALVLDSQAELAASRDSFLKGVKARLLSERPVTLETYAGTEFNAETDQAVFKVRVYVVGRRPYQLVAVTYKGFDDAQSVNSFLSSFRLKSQEQ
jgi:hypothetical protein